ncbi:hypothetical protein [Sphingomonas sp.]|uniref:hypothetical protein n=1 Tax=Sphingomonas sp. TaxID=28214 RepID=UPI003B3AB5DA
MAWWNLPSKRLTSERIIRAAETLARTPVDQQIEALQDQGFAVGEAHRIAALLPLAFSRPVLEELGVSNFVPVVTAVARDGSQVEAKLMRQPEYVVGLWVAREHCRKGLMDHAIYKAVAGGSAEIDAVSNALNAGESLAGSTIASSLVGPDIVEHLIR